MFLVHWYQQIPTCATLILWQIVVGINTKTLESIHTEMKMFGPKLTNFMQEIYMFHVFGTLVPTNSNVRHLNIVANSSRYQHKNSRVDTYRNENVWAKIDQLHAGNLHVSCFWYIGTNKFQRAPP